jgi:hypothetical protein
VTYKEGWLERQLDRASRSVQDWSPTKRESLSLNRGTSSDDSQSPTAIRGAAAEKEE